MRVQSNATAYNIARLGNAVAAKENQAIIIHSCVSSIVTLRHQPLSQSTLTERYAAGCRVG